MQTGRPTQPVGAGGSGRPAAVIDERDPSARSVAVSAIRSTLAPTDPALGPTASPWLMHATGWHTSRDPLVSDLANHRADRTGRNRTGTRGTRNHHSRAADLPVLGAYLATPEAGSKGWIGPRDDGGSTVDGYR